MPSRYRLGLLLSGLAMMAAALLWSELAQGPPPPPVVRDLPPPLQIFALTALQSLEPGTAVSDKNTAWTVVTEANLITGATTRKETDDDHNPYLGQIVIQPVSKGEMLTIGHFASSESANYVARLLLPGKRAFAIAIDVKGTATAGNFILPNDRVDIIRSFNSATGLLSETVLTNIRVLAIGQTIHSDGLSSTGDTATVEVEPAEAELLATAQRSGQISLALRNPTDVEANDARPANIVVIRPGAVVEKAP